MLQIAFKEWASICQALAEGRQALIIRKGGIAESAGIFTPEYSRFWLYPTFVHQRLDGLKKADADSLLQSAVDDQPVDGTFRLRSIAEVSGIYFVRHLEDALALDRFHFWSEETIRNRFNYREPGLYVLPVRIYRLAAPMDIRGQPAYDGCKTWVELDRALSDEGAIPVLDSRTYAGILDEIDQILNPAAFA